jgi:hypothetical protein
MRILIFILTSILLILGCKNKEPESTKKQPVAKEEKHTDAALEEKVEVGKETGPESRPLETGEKTLTDADHWAGYTSSKSALESARRANDIHGITSALLKAAHYAHELNRPDIEAWQYNNLGYYSIKEFKRLTDYKTRLSKIESMPPGKEKAATIENTRTLFRGQIGLLNEAANYLKKADEVDKTLEISDRTLKIKSNMDFVRWVKRFVGTLSSTES